MRTSILACCSLVLLSLPAGAAQGCSTSLDGIVWQDSDCDGVFDPLSGDFVLPGVDVYLLDYKFLMIDQRTTDASGAYAFTGLCTDTYGVMVETSTLPPDLVPTLTGVGDPQFDSDWSPAGFGVLDNVQISDIDFGYKPGCSGDIRGAVWHDVSEDGLQNAIEPGIPNIEVQLQAGGLIVDTVLTDADGDYRFEEVCSGPYTVAVSETTLPAGFTAGTICNISNNAFEHIDNDCTPYSDTIDSGELHFNIDFAYTKPGFVPYCFADQSDCPCANDYPVGGCRNQTGVGAVLAAAGSASIASDDLFLGTSGVTPGQFGVMLMGAAPIRMAFGNGLQCVASTGVTRLRPALQADIFGGVYYLGPGLLGQACSQLGACVQPGERRYFQLWYRDAVGTCGMDSNFTNAIDVCFRP